MHPATTFVAGPENLLSRFSFYSRRVHFRTEANRACSAFEAKLQLELVFSAWWFFPPTFCFTFVSIFLYLAVLLSFCFFFFFQLSLSLSRVQVAFALKQIKAVSVVSANLDWPPYFNNNIKAIIVDANEILNVEPSSLFN